MWGEGIAGRIATAAMALVLAVAVTCPAYGHPGGLNAEGCHNNRKSGDYHCHRSGRSASPPSSGAYDGAASHFSGGSGAALQHSGRAFANCSEARAMGAAPVRRGAPGYGPHLDRDGDGVGCE